MERSSRSDLIAILDWFSDETEDDPSHLLNFELVKSTEQETSHDGEEQMHTTSTGDRSGRKSWLAPIVYHYYIKVIVGGVRSDADNASMCSGDEFGSDSDVGAGDVISNPKRESLEEPLLTSAERTDV